MLLLFKLFDKPVELQMSFSRRDDKMFILLQLKWQTSCCSFYFSKKIYESNLAPEHIAAGTHQADLLHSMLSEEQEVRC